jgi:type II secretory pathway component PulF
MDAQLHRRDGRQLADRLPRSVVGGASGLGEKSGDLGNMLMQVGRYIDKDLKRRTQRMSTLMEPLVTIVLAFVIGTIAMAIYLPIFDRFKQI